MAFQLKEWLGNLAASGGLSAEDVALLEGKLGNPKIVETIQQLHEGGLRQSDYDRKMNELKQTHQTEMERLKGIETGLTNWQKEAQAKLDDATAKYTSALTTKAQYEAALRQVATDYGLDVNTLIPASNGAPPAPPAPNAQPHSAQPQNDEAFKKFQEEFDKTRQVFPFLPAELYDLGVEHQQLFKTPLGETTKLVKAAIEQGKPIRSVWEETFKVAEKRQQVASEEAAAHDASIRADERKKVISEMSVPNFNPAGTPRSPVLQAFPAKNLGQPKPGEMTSIDRAVAAFEIGQREQTTTP